MSLILFLLAGLAAGLAGVIPRGWHRAVQRLTLVSLVALLFLMGVGLTADRGILGHLPSLGLQSLVLAGCAVLATVILYLPVTGMAGTTRRKKLP